MSRIFSLMRDQQLLLSTVIFLLLSSIPSSYQGGKRGRKAIRKAVKRPLSIYSRENKEHYISLVNAGEDCMNLAMERLVDDIGDDAYYINPGILLKFLKWRYPDIMSISNIHDSHIENINEHYIGTGLGFISIKYGNMVVEQIQKYVIPENKIIKELV